VTRNGLAIRNGGVYGHLVPSRGTPPDSPSEFYGDADLLLGIDLLEACRGVHPGGDLRVAHRGRTKAVVNLGAQQTVLSQASRDVLDTGALAGLLRTRTRDDASLYADFSHVAEAEPGSRGCSPPRTSSSATRRGTASIPPAATRSPTPSWCARGCGCSDASSSCRWRRRRGCSVRSRRAPSWGPGAGDGTARTTSSSAEVSASSAGGRSRKIRRHGDGFLFAM